MLNYQAPIRGRHFVPKPALEDSESTADHQLMMRSELPIN